MRETGTRPRESTPEKGQCVKSVVQTVHVLCYMVAALFCNKANNNDDVEK